MEIEKLEIFQYLSTCEPISKLNNETQKQLALSIEIIYAKKGTIILQPNTQNNWLYLVRSGAAERVETNGSVIAQFAEKDFFGQASLKRKGLILRTVRAIEDTLLYRIPGSLFLNLLKETPYFRFYFNRNKSDVTTYQQQSTQSSNLNHVQVKKLLHEKVKIIDHKTSVANCAKLMQQSNLTSLLISKDKEIKGIVTDRAFCTKIVAEGLSYETPIGLVMTEKLLTIDEQATASEALLIMARHNIRHLPVTCEGKIYDVLTATDLIHKQSNNPIYLINQIFKATSIESLVYYAEQIPNTLVQLVSNGFNASDIGYSISSIGRAINQQLLKMAEKKLGQPPVPYAWIIAGSLARNDQTARTDQDNGIIISDKYDEKKHARYFISLAQFVCDGLNQCGYVYCPGDVMATNKKWRQSLDTWKSYFNQWISTPEPKALMLASIFFDLKCIYGEIDLLNELHEKTTLLISGNKKFLNYMAANAMKNTPPLGFFRGFILDKTGKEEKALNMKKRGVVPIVDLARVYALSCDVHAVNTQERLQLSFEQKALSEEGFKDLTDAFEYLSLVRLNHQASQISQGLTADNYMPPEELSSLEKRHLKDTFEVVRSYQNAMDSRYQASLLR